MADPDVLRFEADVKEMQAFLLGISKGMPRTKMKIAAKFFDVAVEVQQLATEYSPTYRGELTASITEYGVRDDSRGGHAKRGVSSKLSVGASMPYAIYLHDGWRDGDPYFLGIGTQPRSIRKGKKQPFRVQAADGSFGTIIKYGYRFGGSAAKNLDNAKVGMNFLRNAFDEKTGSLFDWPELPDALQQDVKDAIKKARQERKV